MENKKLLRQEYQRNYYYKNREQQLLNMYQYYKKNYEDMKEYQRKYYLRNRNQISYIRAEYYINKVKERNKNKNNVVITSNKIIISILED